MNHSFVINRSENIRAGSYYFLYNTLNKNFRFTIQNVNASFKENLHIVPWQESQIFFLSLRTIVNVRFWVCNTRFLAACQTVLFSVPGITETQLRFVSLTMMTKVSHLPSATLVSSRFVEETLFYVFTFHSGMEWHCLPDWLFSERIKCLDSIKRPRYVR